MVNIERSRECTPATHSEHGKKLDKYTDLIVYLNSSTYKQASNDMLNVTGTSQKINQIIRHISRNEYFMVTF